MAGIKEAVIWVKQLIAGSGSDAATRPSIAFGDGDTGFYESTDDTLNITIGGTQKWVITASSFGSTTAGEPRLLKETSTYTNPTINFDATHNASGIGGENGEMSLIAGGVESLRISGAIMFIPNGRTTTPGTPVGGGYLNVSGGALVYTGSAGTQTTIAVP